MKTKEIIINRKRRGKLTRITNDELETFRLNFSTCGHHDVASLIVTYPDFPPLNNWNAHTFCRGNIECEKEYTCRPIMTHTTRSSAN